MAPNPERLVIYFQGGGACWNWVSCSGMFDTRVDAHELAEYRGIFDRSNPGNPFKDFSVLVVGPAPVTCTSETHPGGMATIRSLQGPSRTAATGTSPLCSTGWPSRSGHFGTWS